MHKNKCTHLMLMVISYSGSDYTFPNIIHLPSKQHLLHLLFCDYSETIFFQQLDSWYTKHLLHAATAILIKKQVLCTFIYYTWRTFLT